ncbi:hypothetical protein RAS12_10635 [Achromobacter seleniivolatilans]|uniref:Uncharacterized protein n=1 Tax=Achromobacter seleniivolatilans TaxID=3047478 RepID=A0ABY9M729_9BURK|nr:hypothetical protein [Achromobacter sp. R39]WMD22801.1 hypothetical protein RAS12_10635 [Achromobacter sp. R39]
MKFKALTLGILIASAGASQAATVNEVFNGKMLGTNQRYFESIAGVPRDSFRNDHTFVVQNCQITATIGDGKVTALRLDLGQGCEANLQSFIGEDAPKPGQTITPGVFGSGQRYTASCLAECGNAADPSAYALWQAPRSAGGMEVLMEMVLAGDKAMTAADEWEKQIKQAAGMDYVLATKFNCETRFNSIAEAVFKDVPVNAITVGYGLPTQRCN